MKEVCCSDKVILWQRGGKGGVEISKGQFFFVFFYIYV